MKGFGRSPTRAKRTEPSVDSWTRGRRTTHGLTRRDRGDLEGTQEAVSLEGGRPRFDSFGIAAPARGLLQHPHGKVRENEIREHLAREPQGHLGVARADHAVALATQQPVGEGPAPCILVEDQESPHAIDCATATFGHRLDVGPGHVGPRIVVIRLCGTGGQTARPVEPREEGDGRIL